MQLNGTLITLSEPTESDIKALYFWKYEEQKQEAKKWNAPYIQEKMLTAQEYINTWYHPHHIIDSVPHSLVIKVNDIPIGYVGSYWVDKATQWLEIGIVIYDSSYWNGGFGSEALYLWIGYLFKETRLHRLGISTWSGNKRMIQAAKKSGMVEEARIRQARIVHNEYFDAVKMGILKSEWENFHN